LQPLSLEQIDIYLGSVGKRLAGLRAAIHSDATLRELAQSPLMLSIMTLAYYRMPADIAVSLGEQGMSRQHLFDVYVERMARYRDGEKIYPLFWTNIGLAGWPGKCRRATRRFSSWSGCNLTWLLRSQRRRYANQLRLGVWLVLALAGVLGGLVGWATGNAGGAVCGEWVWAWWGPDLSKCGACWAGRHARRPYRNGRNAEMVLAPRRAGAAGGRSGRGGFGGAGQLDNTCSRGGLAAAAGAGSGHWRGVAQRPLSQ
jgi:hypothetical protein